MIFVLLRAVQVQREQVDFITKVKAAEIATSAGIPVVIMNGAKPTDIYKVLDGKSVGTFF